MTTNELKVADIIGQDLAGYRLQTGYFLQLKADMTFIPAINSESKEIVVCLDKEDLRLVWDALSKKSARVESILLLVSPDRKFGFDVSLLGKEETLTLRVFNKEEITQIIDQREDEAFTWAGAFITLRQGLIADPFAA